jgi:hypothetical protein
MTFMLDDDRLFSPIGEPINMASILREWCVYILVQLTLVFFARMLQLCSISV